MPSQALTDSWTRLQTGGRQWLTPLLERLAAVGAARWRMLLLGLCALWVLANLARLVWLVLPLNEPVSATATAVVNAPVGAGAHAPKTAVDIEAMARWHLFGEVGAVPQSAAPANIEEQAQETALNLQLLGVISASEPALARALIMADGRQQQFAIGDQLPGGGKVVLSKVLVDRVIIDNNGRYETLWLYDPESTARQAAMGTTTQAGPAAAPATVDMRSNAQVTNMAQNYRQQLYQNPASLADVIQVSPANEGSKLLGYRIRPGRDPHQFAQLGFAPDDIVTSINGVSLDDPQRALELYNVIRTAREAAFTIKRGNQEINLMVSLEGNAPSE